MSEQSKEETSGAYRNYLERQASRIGAGTGAVVHHRDGNPWNNDPANLRIVHTDENDGSLPDGIGRYYERCAEQLREAQAELNAAIERGADRSEILRLTRKRDDAGDTGD